MRTTIAVLAAILSFVLTLIAGPVLWLDKNVVDRAGFVQTMSPLGQDDSFKRDLATAIGRRVAAEVPVPEQVDSVVSKAVTAAANGMFDLPGYPEAWNATLERSHALTIGAESKTSTTAFTLDVAPLVDLVVKEANKKLPVKVAGPKVALISMGDLSQRQMIEPVLKVAPYGTPLTVGAVIAFLLALVSARRRGAFLMVAGVGAVVIAVIWKVVTFAGVTVLGQRMGGELEGVVLTRVGDVVTAQVDQTFWAFVIAGLAGFLVGIVIESVRRRKEIRRVGASVPREDDDYDAGFLPGR
ncbi:MAG: hypothetical protein J7474_06915 [Arthrobacter sp.]|nr:hypothetical protein [Arthrobacter sp.]